MIGREFVMLVVGGEPMEREPVDEVLEQRPQEKAAGKTRSPCPQAERPLDPVPADGRGNQRNVDTENPHCFIQYNSVDYGEPLKPPWSAMEQVSPVRNRLLLLSLMPISLRDRV